MKHLFLLLLAANVGLFVWGYQREQAMEHAKPNIRADVGDLRLLSEQNNSLKLEATQEPKPIREAASAPEMKVDELIEVEPDSIGDMSEQVGIEVVTEVVAEIEIELQILPEDKVHENPQTAQKAEDELGQSDEQTTQTEAAKMRDVSLGDTELAEEDYIGEEVKELQFEGGAGSDQVAEIEQKPQTEPAFEPELESMQIACYKLGPILYLASAEGLFGHLMQLGFDAEMHKQSIKKIKGYWVTTPPQESYRDANQKLQELKKVGITDLWLFPRGEYKNAISLGLYSRIANAEVAQAQALKKGVATVVLPRQVEVEQYWLEFQSAEQLPVTEESRMALQEEYPDEKFAIQPCSTIVTE